MADGSLSPAMRPAKLRDSADEVSETTPVYIADEVTKQLLLLFTVYL